MFYYIKGQLVDADMSYAVVDVGGVAYKLTISQNTRDSLPHFRSVSEPPTVLLYTHFSVREDGVELFGFKDLEELDTFKLLTSVSGIGPKVAMSVLSSLSPEKLALAVANEDKKAIASANGIGAKTAARLILELKDKLSFVGMSDEAFSPSVAGSSKSTSSKGSLSEASEALAALGYSKPEILKALKDADPTMSVDNIIKNALKKLF